MSNGIRIETSCRSYLWNSGRGDDGRVLPRGAVRSTFFGESDDLNMCTSRNPFLD